MRSWTGKFKSDQSRHVALDLISPSPPRGAAAVAALPGSNDDTPCVMSGSSLDSRPAAKSIARKMLGLSTSGNVLAPQPLAAAMGSPATFMEQAIGASSLTAVAPGASSTHAQDAFAAKHFNMHQKCVQGQLQLINRRMVC